MQRRSSHVVLITAVSLCCLLVQTIEAGQKVYVGDKAPQGQLAYHQLDHQPWSQLLQKHVDSNGLVDYRSWQSSAQDLALLGEYLRILSSVNPDLKSTREAKLAFWINAYNAVTVQGMLREYPTTSIRNHTAKLYGYNIWKDLQLYVSGKPYSLDDMEHAVLRKMNEPRIHFAVVCASKGCPRLLSEAYVPNRIEEQLDLNARDFFSRSANFHHQGNRLGLSSILKWYGEDFGETLADQLKKFAPWLPTKEAQQAAINGSAKVTYLDYDWSINEQKTNR